MNIGIVGAGKIVKEALPVFEQMQDVTFHSIVSSGRNPQNIETLQKQYNIKHAYEDFTQFITDESLDVIYLAVPNHLHFKFAKLAIEHQKHVICEKPFTLTKAELQTLQTLSQENNVIIIEAINNLYLNNFETLKNSLKEIGHCKIVQFNYSQYSSRYDKFKQGEVQPVFDPDKGGGALMDLNVYNVHLAVGLFGMPLRVTYFPNIERNIDTSGVLILEYESMKVVCVGAKDSTSPNQSTIQGDVATLQINGPTNELNEIELRYNDGGVQMFKDHQDKHRMYDEFLKITDILQHKDYTFAQQQLEHSINVMEVLELALKSANIEVGPSI
ncbi:Gfo/Idh/MocA family oxidoreductase [Staphylococcus sp. Marseille-Q5304]|uniref:Gfo/Idh/MocA family oxidoreductase n=1 Tax=Staphylococcus sp. Marseille-Q5304 TaxID=2942200 RepID=UPI002073606B|nr:Gfo/Idh/MocA family oxidoreductase [Staphylococcus sp. Marseille-Q5304]